MNKETMNSVVNQELKHIPKGGLAQNLFRYVYNMLRRKHLSVSETFPKKVSISECIREIRAKYADFDPDYDRKFFKN